MNGPEAFIPLWPLASPGLRTVPVTAGRPTGTGTVVHAGRTVATAQGKVVDEQGRLVAHGTTTCLIHAPR
jgi:acyl-CoA thioesterase